MFLKKTLCIGLTLLLLAATGCKDKAEGEDPSASSFNKEAMLANIGQEVIMASYDDFDQSLQTLEQSFANFKGEDSEANFAKLQSDFKVCYEKWQHCSPFQFGPALEVSLRQTVAVFPTDTPQIVANLNSGSYDLASAQNANAKGLAAIDFILFANGSTSAALSGSDAQMDYIEANLDLIRTALDQVIVGWSSAGNDYLAEFSGNTTTSVGSPIGQLVNELNFDFELLKNAKIGIPLGKKTLGETQVEKVEAIHSAHSVALAIANLDGIMDGLFGGEGSGLDDYLDALDARYEGQKLSAAIKDQYDQARASLEAIDGPLDDAIRNDPTQVEKAYTDLQNMVVLLKTDMASQLAVQITYQDNDGD